MATKRIGNYLIHREIGAGGMAAVHLGRLVGAGGFARPVAIKRLHRHLARDAAFREMFLDEARIAARVTHPNVVSTIDFVSHGDELLLVMELVQGVSLVQILASLAAHERKLPVAIAAAIIAGVLRGLAAAHEATDDAGSPLGLVHRDVSPHNVLIDLEGVAKVVDFGIARAHGRARETGSGELKGKLGYMSPEQLRGDPLDARADLYAVAVVLWEMLVGRPLRRGDAASILYDALERAPATPSASGADVPPALDAVVMRGLAKDRDARFSSAAAMEEALVQSTTPATNREVARWLRENEAATLDRQAIWIAEIEQTDPSTLAPPEVRQGAAAPEPSPPPRREAQRTAQGTEILEAAPPKITPGGTEPMASAPPLPRRRPRRALGIAVALAVTGALALTVAWMLRPQAVPTAPVTSSASSLPSAPTSPGKSFCGEEGGRCCDDGCRGPYLTCKEGRCKGCVKKLYAGDAATAACAVRGDGKVFCWGSNEDLVFGIKARRRASTPFALDGIHDPSLLTFSRETALAVIDDKLVGWGSTEDGVLGPIAIMSARIDASAPVELGLHGVTAIGIHGGGAGSGSACAIAGGALHCWGRNSGGVAGEWHPDRGTEVFPPSHIVPLTRGERPLHLALGRESPVCVETDVGTTCWRRPSIEAPVPVPNEVESPVSRLFVTHDTGTPFLGGLTGCLLRNGSPYCWGANVQCEVGRPRGAVRSAPRQPFPSTPLRLLTLSLGSDHLCGIDVNLQLVCWGANKYGQAGADPEVVGDKLCEPNYVPLDVGVAHVVAADGFTCVLDAFNVVHCFGNDESGQLGTGARTPPLYRATPQPVMIPCVDAPDASPR